MVLLARGNKLVLLDLGLVKKLYFDSSGSHFAVFRMSCNALDAYVDR